MNIKTLGFGNAGDSGTQDSSVTQASSRTPLATIISADEAGEVKGECFGSIVSFFGSLKMCINVFKIIWFYKNRT